MTPDTSNSQHARLLHMLEMAQGAGGGEENGPEPVEYDWTTPHYFTRNQLERAGKFATLLAEKVSKVMSEVLRETLTVHPEPISEHYGTSLREQEARERSYWIRVTDDPERYCGLLVFSQDCASAWMSKMLGGSWLLEGNEERKLSGLEKMLMGDIVVSLSGALSEASQAVGGGSFRMDGEVSADKWELPKGEVSEFCKIALRQEDSDKTPGVSLLLLNDVLDTIAGVKTPRSQDEALDVYTEMAAYVERSAVTVMGWLGATAASLEGIIALEPGDVILIQRKVSDPIDLAVQDRYVLSGLPVVCEGRYAVQVTVPPGQGASSGAPDTSRVHKTNRV